MRTVLCLRLVVVFLFSLPWRLNSKVTPAINIKRNNWHIAEHQRLTHAVEKPSGLRHDSSDAGKENVVSLSQSGLMQHLTSESGQHIRLKTSNTDRLNQRRKRNTEDNGHNLTTPMQTQTEGKTLKQEPPSSLRPRAILNTTISTSPIQPHTNISLHEGTTIKWFLDTTDNKTPKTTQETPSTSTGSNETSLNSDIHTVQPTQGITVQPSPTTQTHTFAVTSVQDFNEAESMKTTPMEITTLMEKNTIEITTGLDINTSMGKPVKITTTLQTTTVDLTLSPNKTQKKNPGKAVAAVIGTTFILMFIAIIYILVRKQKMQRKQQENPEWAGPSPFLDSDVQPNLGSPGESESVNRRGLGQISKYLPQRLSKHLMLQRDTNEVFMGDILQGSSTFGNHNLEDIQSTNGEPQGNSTFGNHNLEDVQSTNGEPALVEGLAKTEENKNHQGLTSVESVNSKSPAVTVNIKESNNQNDDITTTPSQDTVVKTLPPLVSIDLDSLSEETAPSQTSDVGNIPPAPPLP